MFAKRALKFFICLFVWLGVVTPGHATTELENSLSQARQLKLWQNPKWIRLGHYRKGLFSYHSPFSQPFFISPEGSNDPEAELETSIAAFLAPTQGQLNAYKMHPACFFQARFKWLKRELKFAFQPDCSEREEWKKRLAADSLSLIFAASDLGTATSSFGHIFLKISSRKNSGKLELIDYGLNYSAEADKSEGVLYAAKGLFGFYPGNFSLLPYHQKLREYVNLEGRDVWEYPLTLSAEETNEFLDHILEFEGSGAPYYFLSDNCSFEVLKALEAVRLDINISEKMPWFVIPLDTLKHLSNTPGVLQEPRFRPSLKFEYIEAFRALNKTSRKVLSEAVQTLKLPEKSGLSQTESAQVLEAAMKFYALKNFREERDFRAQIYELSVQRSKLGVLPPQDSVHKPVPPETGSDSSALGIGYGEMGNSRFSSFRFRSAFHDLEQIDIGVVPFSDTEVLGFEARHIEGDRLEISRATLVRLLNAAPVTPLERPLSWRARVEVFDPWHSEFEGGIGYSADIEWGIRGRITGLLDAEYAHPGPRIGPNVILALRPAERLGLSLDAGYFYGREPEPSPRLRWKADLSLARHWDLQGEVVTHKEHQVRLLYNFLQ